MGPRSPRCSSREGADAQVRAYAERFAHGAGARHQPRSSGASTRAGDCRWPTGSRSRRELDRAPVPLAATRARGCTHSSRSAHRSSSAHDAPTTITNHAGRVHRRARARQQRRPALPGHQPRNRRDVRRGRGRHRRGRRRRPSPRPRAPSRVVGAGGAKRGEILGRAARHVEEHLDELIPLLTREQGKTLRDSRIELTKAIDTLMHYVGLSKALRGVHTPSLDPGVDGIVLRRPLGVVGAIVPWNFPTTLLCNKLAPALVAGNTVVAKPAGTTPLTYPALLRAAVRGRPAGRRVQRRHRQRVGDRHRARHPPRRPQDRVHRLDAGRRADHGAGRARHQARDARARRL